MIGLLNVTILFSNPWFQLYTTGLSKRNGANLRESFCPAAASHSRPRQAGAYQNSPFFLHKSVFLCMYALSDNHCNVVKFHPLDLMGQIYLAEKIPPITESEYIRSNKSPLSDRPPKTLLPFNDGHSSVPMWTSHTCARLRESFLQMPPKSLPAL